MDPTEYMCLPSFYLRIKSSSFLSVVWFLKYQTMHKIHKLSSPKSHIPFQKKPCRGKMNLPNSFSHKKLKSSEMTPCCWTNNSQRIIVPSSLGSTSPNRVHCLNLKMEALQSFETAGTVHPITRVIPAHLHLQQQQHCENPTSFNFSHRL